VRKFLIALLGALVLQLVLVQAAVADDPTDSSTTTTTTGPTTTTTGQTTTTSGQATTTTAGQATTTTGGQATTTTTTAGQTTTTGGQATTTTAGQTTTTTGPEAGPEIGVFDRQPASGPVGTVITVKSVTPCVPPEDAPNPEVEVVLFNEQDIRQGTPTIDEVFEVGADGTWSGQVTVPGDAGLGEYFIDAACFAGASLTEEPFLIYEPQTFTVTPAVVTAPARPAVPVPGTPNFVG
jgi:hypothetical protein